MRCLVQSRETGRFVVPADGYLGWSPSLRYALKCGLVEAEEAAEIVADFCDATDVDVVPVKD